MTKCCLQWTVHGKLKNSETLNLKIVIDSSPNYGELMKTMPETLTLC